MHPGPVTVFRLDLPVLDLVLTATLVEVLHVFFRDELERSRRFSSLSIDSESAIRYDSTFHAAARRKLPL